MIPKIKIKDINNSQLYSFNQYLGLCKNEIKKSRTDFENATLCLIFGLHLKLTHKLMFVQNPNKPTTLSVTHAEAYSILGYGKIVSANTSDAYNMVVIKDIAARLHKALI